MLAQQGDMITAVHGSGGLYMPLIALVTRRHGSGVYALFGDGTQRYIVDHVYEYHARDKYAGYIVATQ